MHYPGWSLVPQEQSGPMGRVETQLIHGNSIQPTAVHSRCCLWRQKQATKVWPQVPSTSAVNSLEGHVSGDWFRDVNQVFMVAHRATFLVRNHSQGTGNLPSMSVRAQRYPCRVTRENNCSSENGDASRQERAATLISS